MKRLLLTLALILLAFPATAQLRFVQDENCQQQTTVGRGCLMIESSLPVFIDLRDELVQGYKDNGDGTVDFVCSQCSVDKNVTGCGAVGNVVPKQKRDVALHKIACLLTNIRADKLLRDARQTAEDTTDTTGDIGEGDPSG